MVFNSVYKESSHFEAPPEVRFWIDNPSSWLSIQPAIHTSCHKNTTLQALDDGEAEAILVATMVNADLILMDDRAGVTAARAKGFAVTGTLGVIDLAARQGLIDLALALDRLKKTNFRYRPQLLDELLTHHDADQKTKRPFG